MISYEEAKKIVQSAGQERACGTEVIDIQDSVGRVCAEDIEAPIDVQPFDNSAMDGFAVRVGDLGENGGVLTKTGMVAAGNSAPEGVIQAGHCVEVMTGAPVPSGAQAVVLVEQVTVNGDQISFSTQIKVGANIRRAGEDFKKGMAVLKVGQEIYPQHIMPLATLGIGQVAVFKTPQVVYLTTGLELVDDLSQELKSGQIYNSNAAYMKAALKAMGLDAVYCGTIADDSERFQKKISCAVKRNVDIIISTGAVSAGKFDFIRECLEQLGAEILFHRVKIKPGKPNLFARFPNGTLYFGLPGNPVATTAGLRFFVQPCLRAMMSMEEEKPVQAKAATSFKKRKELKMFLKARAGSGKDGAMTVDLLDGQASFMVSPFLNMNCWAVAPEGVEEIKEGDIVDLYPLYSHAGWL